MLQNFWVSMANQALKMLTSSDFVNDVAIIVKSLINADDLTGNEKRLEAIADIKSLGYSYASWLINATIELSLGYLKLKCPELFKVIGR